MNTWFVAGIIIYRSKIQFFWAEVGPRKDFITKDFVNAYKNKEFSLIGYWVPIKFKFPQSTVS